ncbi:MAG: hypothetical protein ACTHLA_17710 [Asticcacaulis sp.]|uniref:hypothetical protein n=1 Tax=Asticcacaulis sp. TaxID=1872648 RepID=UPI003F7BD35C
MGIRLYDGVWVRLEGVEQPARAFRDKANPGIFHIDSFDYDVDGRAVRANPDAPPILELFNLETAKAAGLDMRSFG